jgi:hypothetical protein
LSSASEHEVSTAAPTPCTARAPISTARFGASPHAMDATTKTPNPAANTRLAPMRSPSAPAVRISAANTSV